MALDFKLDLILPHQNAAIFYRCNIEATHYLIKQQLPALAAQLSDLLSGEPLPLDEELLENIDQQCFYVDLHAEQVITITELLLQILQDEHNVPTQELQALAQTLYSDWHNLAHNLAIEAQQPGAT